MRILFDTNVLASSIATRGLCVELLEIVLNEHELLTCDPVDKKLRRVLADKFKLPEAIILGFLGLLDAQGQRIATPEESSLTCSDSDDIPILACAASGRADIFVTGDKALLDLGSVEDTAILSPRQCWQKLVEVG